MIRCRTTGNKGRKSDTLTLSKEFFSGADIDIEVRAKVIYESDTEDIIQGLENVGASGGENE